MVFLGGTMKLGLLLLFVTYVFTALPARAGDSFLEQFKAQTKGCQEQGHLNRMAANKLEELKLEKDRQSYDSKEEALKALQELKKYQISNPQGQKALALMAAGIPNDIDIKEFETSYSQMTPCLPFLMAYMTHMRALLNSSEKFSPQEKAQVKTLIVGKTKEQLSYPETLMGLLVTNILVTQASKNGLLKVSQEDAAQWEKDRLALRELSQKINTQFPKKFSDLDPGDWKKEFENASKDDLQTILRLHKLEYEEGDKFRRDMEDVFQRAM
jgi:hypothetical protein